MNYIFRIFLYTGVIFLLFGSTNDLSAQRVSKVGTTAGEFLKIGVGSRATAMGGAFVAVSNDVSSLYWNPAGIAKLEKNEILTSHSSFRLPFRYPVP